MAEKAPAFQFYSSDFMVGVMYWEHDLVGKYILLICWQHQHGFISKKDMSNICNSSVDEIDKKLLDKFVLDDNGNYYNERLKEVIDKQIAYSESRKKNRMSAKKPTKKTVKKKKVTHDNHMSNTSKSYDRHMEDEDEDKDRDIIINSFIKDTDVIASVKEFYQMRIEMKKPMTERALKMFLKKLLEIGSTDKERIEIINRSIINDWQDVFPLNNKKESAKQLKQSEQPNTSRETQASMSDEEREALKARLAKRVDV